MNDDCISAEVSKWKEKVRLLQAILIACVDGVVVKLEVWWLDICSDAGGCEG